MIGMAIKIKLKTYPFIFAALKMPTKIDHLISNIKKAQKLLWNALIQVLIVYSFHPIYFIYIKINMSIYTISKIFCQLIFNDLYE